MSLAGGFLRFLARLERQAFSSNISQWRFSALMLFYCTTVCRPLSARSDWHSYPFLHFILQFLSSLGIIFTEGNNNNNNNNNGICIVNNMFRCIMFSWWMSICDMCECSRGWTCCWPGFLITSEALRPCEFPWPRSGLRTSSSTTSN